MHLRHCAFLFHVYHQACRIDALNDAEITVRRLQVSAFADLYFLRWKSITIHWTNLRAADARHEFEPGDGGALFDQFFVGELPEPEILPPGWLVFTTMPLQQVSHNPFGMLFRRSTGRIIGDIKEETFHQLEHPGSLLIDDFSRVAGFDDRSGNRATAHDQILPDVLEPVPELQRGNAVFAVIRFHGVTNLSRHLRDVVQFKSTF